MSLAGLTKEQKQYLLLGVIVCVAALILIAFGIKVSLSSITVAREELAELSNKIESAEMSVDRNERNAEEFHTSIAELQNCLAAIPPERNYYSWATEVIYDEARQVDFEIDAIDEMVMPAAADMASTRDKVVLESYALRIAAHGGYETVKQFLRKIEENHPLARITGMEISAGAGPEVHDVLLFIEWPFNMGYITEAWGSIKSIDPLQEPDAPDSDEPLQKPHPPAPRDENGQPSGLPSADATA